MSKRPASPNPVEESSLAKRVCRSEENHSAGCNDPDCDGCDVGDIEITFVGENEEKSADPSAQELLNMAIEESTDPDAKPEVVQRLFDMAIDKFGKTEPKDRIGYATCLIELGQAIKVEESLKEGLDILRGETKKPEIEPSTLFILARAAALLAAFIRQNKNALYEEAKAELEDSDGEGDEAALDELSKKQAITREEGKLYKEAIGAIDKGFATYDPENEEQTKTLRVAMRQLLSYGQLLEDPSHGSHVGSIMDKLVSYIQRLENESDSSLLTEWAACLLHKSKFEDIEKQKELCDEVERILLKSNKVYKETHQEENPWGWELYAMLKMNQSNLADNEDEILEKFSEAVDTYKKALDLNPGNKELAEMVSMLEGSPDDEDEDEEEEEEEE
ncbi:hypothetical protein CLU79DRAFT_758940 [Phycomyces nitens]|nr:hypothetical protein CLU79DRAFT_758940 [Phycomyces nitens]